MRQSLPYRRRQPVSKSLTTDTEQAQNLGPSFDCKLAESQSERAICRSVDLSKLDRELRPIYEKAKRRVAQLSFAGDVPKTTPAEWFRENAKQEWLFRERQCQGDVSCLEYWYLKRRALLSWIAFSDDSVGDYGVKSVLQLGDGATLISYSMATHVRNVLYNPETDEFRSLPDGRIKILSESPFRYFLVGKKGYWNAGGVFFFNSLRDADNRILFIEPEEPQNPLCFSKEEFAAKTAYTLADLALVQGGQVCVSG